MECMDNSQFFQWRDWGKLPRVVDNTWLEMMGLLYSSALPLSFSYVWRLAKGGKEYSVSGFEKRKSVRGGKC